MRHEGTQPMMLQRYIRRTAGINVINVLMYLYINFNDMSPIQMSISLNLSLEGRK